MTSTLASMRQLSVRSDTATFDVAVPLGTRVGDLLASGGFPPGSHLVDASGAPFADDDLAGEAFEDGAIVYVVDAVHTPTLTRVGQAAPARGTAAPGRATPGRAAPGRPARAEAAPAGTPAPDHRPAAAAQVQVDAAAAGARTRSAARRGRGRPEVPGAGRPGAPDSTASGRGGPPTTGRRPTGDTGPGGAPSGVDPAPDVHPDGGDDARPARRAVGPPAVRRAPGAAPGGSGLLPPPPGPSRSPVPLPPGGVARPGAHAASDDDTRAGTDVAVRLGTGLGVPPPPRIAPPPTGATGRGSVTPPAGHRAGDPAPDTPVRPRGGPADVALSPGAYAVPLVLAPAAVLVTVVATLGDRLPTWSDWTAGAVLLVAAVVAAIRPGTGPLQRWGRIAAAVSGGCGAFVLATALEVDLDVAAVAGLVVASAVAMLGRTSAIRAGVFEPWITVTAVATGAVAVDAALAIVLSWPAYVAPLLLAGASPLVMRALPAVALDVPDEQLIDTERLSNTSWSARTGVRRRRRALRQATVELITVRAAGVVAAGTVTIAVFVVAGYGLAVLSTMPGALARWALLAEGVLLLGGLGLAGRTVRARFGKRVLRLTAVVVTLETGYHLTRLVGDAGTVVLVALLVGVALGVVAVSVALDSGWRSLRLSRLADAAEGFCVVFALPAALLAVDVLAVLRQAAS